ncbi:orotate phosphoribosyltransferase [Salipiger marinus]|jgi:orotate phosphoribosyltransferase|nr:MULTISPECIES: orotate phosphoribosyltransferase [Salipiger]MEB3421662.1 orotate phosphoribosyltransferase [Salipiger manganoxidans]|tara:strand:+ start:913 stop:1623 length:711 start_codon:yes stop_codon:yes gene_type:complete
MKEVSAMPLAPETRADYARRTARALLQIGAVETAQDRPFILSSGIASPVYINVRRVISYPAIREMLMGFATEILDAEIGRDRIDAVAGAETAGIPFAAWIAALSGLPMQYVRKRAQGFGPAARIEGVSSPGQRVLLVEDLTTDGASKIRFCEALRQAGMEISDVLMLFHYDIFPATRTALAERGLRLHALANWRDILAATEEQQIFTPAERSRLAAFIEAPLDWSAAHGGSRHITF